MATSRFVRWSGLAAVAGGALWVMVFAIHALRSSAEGSDALYVSLHGLGFVGVLSLLLVAVGLVGLDVHTPSGREEGYGKLGRAGYAVALGGVLVTMIVSGAPGGIGVLGTFMLGVGTLLVGVGTLLWRVLPRWGAVVLIGCSLSLLLFEAGGLRAWFGVPYGAAWIAVGYLLSSGGARQVQAGARDR